MNLQYVITKHIFGSYNGGFAMSWVDFCDSRSISSTFMSQRR